MEPLTELHAHELLGGWPDDDLRQELKRRLLSLDDLADMRSQVRNLDWPLDHEGRHVLESCVRALYARAFTPKAIGILFELPEYDVIAAQRARHKKVDDRTILAAHIAGLTPVEIHRATGIHRNTARSVLLMLGIDPNRRRSRLDPAAKERAMSMRRQGTSYGEIAKATGLDRDQVKSVLNAARRKGLL